MGQRSWYMKDFHFIRSALHPFRNPPYYSRRRRGTSHDNSLHYTV